MAQPIDSPPVVLTVAGGDGLETPEARLLQLSLTESQVLSEEEADEDADLDMPVLLRHVSDMARDGTIDQVCPMCPPRVHPAIVSMSCSVRERNSL